MPEKDVKLRATGLVGRDHFPVENGVIDLELRRDLVAELIEAAQVVAVP